MSDETNPGAGSGLMINPIFLTAAILVTSNLLTWLVHKMPAAFGGFTDTLIDGLATATVISLATWLQHKFVTKRQVNLQLTSDNQPKA